MCGIAGVVDPRRPSQYEEVERQLRHLDHRGPDSWGIFEKSQATIGQTRLAIIDVSGGDPPIANEDGSIGAVLNGEIYNYLLLGDELRHDGHRFTTRCDTEVLAHLAEQLEPAEIARRLEGMFAFAVWDDRRQRLVLGRDRLGKKPLYYWTDGRAFVFGSEIKAVLAHPAVPRTLDVDAMPAYLRLGYVPTPRTFFAGVVSVPPGHVLVLDRNGALQLHEYWAPKIAGADGVAPLNVSVDEAAREVRTHLVSAVQRRLIADVPLGAFLSGGVDSSAIVAIMASLSDRPVRTFTIGFEDDEGFDERPYARIVAERFATEHVEFVVEPDAVELVERLVWHHDQPFGDSSAVPTFLLSELTRGHVTVALCGDGGDELFAGYERFAAALVLNRYQQLPSGASQLVAAGVSRLPSTAMRGRGASLQRFMARANTDVVDAFLSWVSYVPEDWCGELQPNSSDWAKRDYKQKWAASEGADLLDRLLDLTLRTYLLDDLLPKVDRMSMAHGLEVRSPFLDRELVELALRLPRAARVLGMSRKRALKRAVRDLLPAEILNRRKRGFSVPLDRWFRSDLRHYVDTTLGSAGARLRQHVVPEAIDRLLAEHHSGKVNHRDTLWTLLTLEIFLRREGW
jgi:asparagine synthase (glutamine-hydrolysing)